MNDAMDPSNHEDRGRGQRRMALALGLTAGVMIIVTTWFYNFYYPRRIGLAQPISFSHRVHANDKRISCFLCHSEATNGRRAGVPPLETCMLCHLKILTTHPEIRKLRGYFDRGEPVQWEEIYGLQDFVYFNHQAHIRRRVDCGVCHGNVLEMDRVVQVHEFNMGFCVQCHRDNKISHDCWICHR